MVGKLNKVNLLFIIIAFCLIKISFSKVASKLRQTNSDNIQLVIDSQDIYQEDPNIFYMNPNRLSLLRFVSENLFTSCLIQNSPVDVLTSVNFSYILRLMKVDAACEVIFTESYGVMLEFDVIQALSNAKLAGFTNIEEKPATFVNKYGVTVNTKSLRFSKPATNPNAILQNDIVITTKGSSGTQTTKPSTTKTGTTTVTKSPAKK